MRVFGSPIRAKTDYTRDHGIPIEDPIGILLEICMGVGKEMEAAALASDSESWGLGLQEFRVQGFRVYPDPRADLESRSPSKVPKHDPIVV